MRTPCAVNPFLLFASLNETLQMISTNHEGYCSLNLDLNEILFSGMIDKRESGITHILTPYHFGLFDVIVRIFVFC